MSNFHCGDPTCALNDKDMDEKIEEEMAGPDGKEGRYWWLSFADGGKPRGQEFLGACVVRASGFVTAIIAAKKFGCYPGGEVVGIPLTMTNEEAIAVFFVFANGDRRKDPAYRLLARPEAEQLYAMIDAHAASRRAGAS